MQRRSAGKVDTSAGRLLVSTSMSGGKIPPGNVVAAIQRYARGNSLFRNTGDGKFQDVSLSSGVTMGRWAWGSRFVDLNNDGWEDIVVTNGMITQEDPGDL